MNEVEKNMAVSALAQLLDQQPTAYAEVLAACRAMGWNASPTAQPADIIDELPSNVLPLIRRMLALLIYGDGSSDSPAVVPVTERCYAQMVPRVTSPNYPAAGFPSDGVRPFLPDAPSIRDFAHLPQALSALSARKISGVPEAPDGISLDNLILSDANDAITKLTDSNIGWTQTKPLSRLLNAFPSVTEIALNMAHRSGNSILLESNTISKLELPYLEDILGYQPIMRGYTGTMKSLSLPSLKKYDTRSVDNSNSIVYNCPNLEELLMESLEFVHHYSRDNGSSHHAMIGRMAGLKKVVFGHVTTFEGSWTGYNNFIIDCPLLIDLEFKSLSCSANLAFWSPTLDSSNLDQFLQNFRSHIALRLTDNGSGKTLTLSQAVYDAIKDETHLFVFDEGTMTIYAYLTNIKHWTVTK